MKIIISPAKQMRVEEHVVECFGKPIFMKEATELMKWMQTLSFLEAKKLWRCNDKIAKQNVQRLSEMKQCDGVTPALLSYVGIQYQYMAPTIFEDKMLDYVQRHLRILSGFYGVLKPLDGIIPYRLEMQAKIEIGSYKDLYEYWNEKLYCEIMENDEVIINLASKEYSKCIETYLEKNKSMITCVFGEYVGNKIVQKGTYAKMARGEMVRFMAEHKVEEPEEIKKFDRLDYRYLEEESDDSTYVFVRNGKGKEKNN